jgi:16S rRNA (cytosine967-C5)-methyltransferase
MAKQKQKVTYSRICAYDALSKVNKRDAFARDVIEKSINKAKLAEADRAFATRLVLGCVQMQGTLDYVINRALKSPKDVRPNVRDALRISTYEIIFLDKSPHAAVNEGVELVRSVEPKAAGLANATLRKVVGMKPEFPFGDPECDIDAFARGAGYPPWLAKLFVANMGSAAAREFMLASNAPAPLYVAVNSLCATDAEVVSEFARAKVDLQPATIFSKVIPGAYLVPNTHILTDARVKRLFAQGKILVADTASQFVALLVASAHKAQSLLEIGAGRATKTILLQNYSNRSNDAQIDQFTCVDNIGFKSKLLLDRAKVYGAHVQGAVVADATDAAQMAKLAKYDTVFIDSPCSGLGTLRRHPEIRWRISPESLRAQSERQTQILACASAHVAPGGVLAYATCSPISAEDEQIIDGFLQSPAGQNFEYMQVMGQNFLKTNMVKDNSDAHFLALLRRKSN